MRVIVFIMVIGFVQSSLSHPGPTNKKGCHINSDNGRKHCHEVKKSEEEKRQLSQPIRIFKTKKPKKKKS